MDIKHKPKIAIKEAWARPEAGQTVAELADLMRRLGNPVLAVDPKKGVRIA